MLVELNSRRILLQVHSLKYSTFNILLLYRLTDIRKEMDNESDDGQFSENEILSVLCSAFKTGETSMNIINKGMA